MKKQHLSTDTKAANEEEKVDKRLQDSFPTSDPPSHNPGSVGAPEGRRGDLPRPKPNRRH